MVDADDFDLSGLGYAMDLGTGWWQVLLVCWIELVKSAIVPKSLVCFSSLFFSSFFLLFSSASRAAFSFLSSFFPALVGLALEPEGRLFAAVFVLDLGCNSGIGILLRWTVRLVGGAYLGSFVTSPSGPSFRLIRFGPF